MTLTAAQLATVLAALRYWQRCGLPLDVPPPEAEYFTSVPALDNDAIDDLCLQINVITDPDEAVRKALKVLVLTKHIREYLMDTDPQALRQAFRALAGVEPGATWEGAADLVAGSLTNLRDLAAVLERSGRLHMVHVGEKGTRVVPFNAEADQRSDPGGELNVERPDLEAFVRDGLKAVDEMVAGPPALTIRTTVSDHSRAEAIAAAVGDEPLTCRSCGRLLGSNQNCGECRHYGIES
jgi:hypothetical protein